jgi:very-short-patch-repair endonuclease
MTANAIECAIHGWYAAGFGTCPECSANGVNKRYKKARKPKDTVAPKAPQSALEAEFAAIYALYGADLPALKTEYRFHPVRMWRFDFCMPSPYLIAIEIDGGVWGGRHTRGKGFIEDCYKLNAAAAMGYRVLRYTSEHLKNPFAVIAEIRALVGLLSEQQLAA